MRQITIYKHKYDVKEMTDWTDDFSKQFHAGDLVDQEIVDYFRDVLPPRSMDLGYLQVGEPHSHVPDSEGRYRATYATFNIYDREQRVWSFCGYCYGDELKEPKKQTIRTEVY